MLVALIAMIGVASLEVFSGGANGKFQFVSQKALGTGTFVPCTPSAPPGVLSSLLGTVNAILVSFDFVAMLIR